MNMKLNTIRAASGARNTKHRLGRGIGSGLGKTSGKGHKGQKARAGGYHKIGFEGGQMPIQRRLPKRGFYNLKSRESIGIGISKLLSLAKEEIITIPLLKKNKLVPSYVNRVRIYRDRRFTASETINIKLEGLLITQGVHEVMKSNG